MSNSQKNIVIKGALLSSLLLFLGISIVFRLVQLQYFESEKYEALAMQINFRDKKVHAKRGNLYAADGSLIATSVDRYNIYLDMVTVKQDLFDAEINPLSISLGRMFHQPTSYFEKKLRKARKKGNQYLLLVKGLEYTNYLKIKSFPILEKGKFNGGLIIEKTQVRIHPSKRIGERTIGYDNDKGKVGLEGAYSDYLSGKDGERLEQRITSKQWKPVSFWNKKDPIEGSDVYTTIDPSLQEVAYKALIHQLHTYQAQHGSVVVMEVETGEIKAMVNLDRTKDGNYADTRNWAVYEKQEPGSTFKPVSILAAMEAGFVDENTFIDTGNGTYTIRGNTIRDSHPLGTLSLQGIIEESSNVGTAKIMQMHYRKNPKKFINQLKDWKMDQKLGLEIPGESQPYITQPNQKAWNKLTLAWMSYGYNVQFTPLQMLTFYNGIANDGKMVKPLFIKKIVHRGKLVKEFSPVVLVEKMAKKKNITQMKKMLEGVIANGTATNLYIKNFRMAGKTGTTQIEYWRKDIKQQYIASFAGFFPVNKPKYSCFVSINRPNPKIGFYGAEVAGPVFKSIAKRVFTKTPTKRLVEKNKLNLHVAQSILNKEEFEFTDNRMRMPSLKGENGSEVIPIMENKGLKVKYIGIGRVKKQSIPANQTFKKGQILYLELES